MHTTMDIILEIVLRNKSDTLITLSMLGFAQIEKIRIFSMLNSLNRSPGIMNNK